MSFYHDQFVSHSWAQQVVPASPVPSYQTSSQSGNTSPGGNSSTSDTLSDFSIGSSSSPSPVRSSPSSPSSHLSCGARPPLSPSLSGTTGQSSQFNYREEVHDSNYEAATAQSKATFRETSRGEVLHLVTPGRENADNANVNSCKSEQDVARERGANMRALALLETTVGRDVKNVTRAVSLNKSINEFKSETETYRERGANMRALALLEDTAGKDVSALAKATSLPKAKAALTTRQAAQLQYDNKIRRKADMKAKAKLDSETYGKRVPMLVAKVGKEAMAESSRKPRDKTAEDIRDPDTVAGMKCQMDIELEKLAMRKALELLSYGSMS